MLKLIFFIFCTACCIPVFAQTNMNDSIEFRMYANGKRLVLNDSTYSNYSGESYAVSKLKFYVSNIHFITANGSNAAEQNIYLVDAAKESKVPVQKAKGNVIGVSFTLGVDSLLNCSGAQSGALDPLNDMFWTWNSGYVMFKLEGTSDSSKSDQKRLEYHIGGYKGNYKTMRPVSLSDVQNRDIDMHVVIVNLDNFWNGENKLRIAETPVITTIGEKAKQTADNFQRLFSFGSELNKN